MKDASLLRGGWHARLASLWQAISASSFACALRQLVLNGRVARWSVWGVILLGLALRLYAARGWNSHHPDSPQRLIGDEPGYDNLAREMLQGYGFTWPGRVPLYPAWLAGVYWLTGGSYNAVPYVQSLLGAAVIGLTYWLGRKIFDPAAGLLAAFGAAISYILIHQSLHLLSEILYTPVMVIVALTLWEAMRAPAGKRFAWAGFWVGLSALVRPALLFFPLFLIAVLMIVERRRQALRWGMLYALAAGLAATPWIARNYVRYHALFPLQTSNAILWQGSPEYYHLVRDQGYTYMQVWTQVLYGPGWEERDPTSVEGDRYWTARALRSIASEPITYAMYTVEKLGTYWVGDPNADWNDTFVFNYAALRQTGFSRRDAILVMAARFLPILALLSSCVLWKQWRVLLPIYTLLAYCTLLHAATHAEARLSEPLQPFLLILITGAAVTLWVAFVQRVTAV